MADVSTIFDNLPDDNAINRIIDEFDFELVRSYMMINNWKIATSHNFDLVIPSIEDLKETARGILENAELIENNPSFVYTAGLMATKWGDELSLYFIIENKTEERRFE
jgi:hypothetical protein